LVETSVQRLNANYFGQYIEESIKAIPPEDRTLAEEKGEPVALIIGSNPYRRQIEDYLINAGLVQPDEKKELSARELALEYISQNVASNLGWRIILSDGDQSLAQEIVRTAAEKNVALVNVIPEDYKKAVLAEAENRALSNKAAVGEASATSSLVKVTSFEGAKGMAAQYVFLVGLQSGDIPRQAENIQDIEICRFLVGMTRTKKKCVILITGRFGQDFKRPSEFLSWIKPERFEIKRIDAAYWKKATKPD
jgi:superfamily I DNA/RNA helicase